MENGDARASGSPSGRLLVSVPRRDAHVAENPPECRYCARFALNNGERLFEPKWLAPQKYGFTTFSFKIPYCIWGPHHGFDLPSGVLRGRLRFAANSKLRGHACMFQMRP